MFLNVGLDDGCVFWVFVYLVECLIDWLMVGVRFGWRRFG